LSKQADLIVAGAGPSGCAAAIVAARAGLDVVVLDKAYSFPRCKACGDALTPRAVAALDALGVALPAGAHAVRGLVAYGTDGHSSRFEWPATTGLPTTAYTLPRSVLDATLLDAAVKAGARVSLGQPVTGLRFDGARVGGVVTSTGEWAANVVVDATGGSSRLGDAAGMPRLPARPLGVAVRGYMRAESGDQDWLHSWLALDDESGGALAGYGWVFPMGDGLYNVGVGQLSTSPGFRATDYRRLLRHWVAGLDGWDLRWQQGDPIVGAALPMGIDREVLYRRGLLLVGDAAGLVNPFNGEGVSYGLQSGKAAGLAVARAAAAGFGTPAAEQQLQGYHHAITSAFGGYYAAGNLFAKLMGHRAVLDICLRYGLPRPWVMRPVNKLMANLMAPRGGPLDDRLVHLMIGLVPR